MPSTTFFPTDPASREFISPATRSLKPDAPPADVAFLKKKPTAIRRQGSLKKIHGRRADEARDEQVRRPAVKLHRPRHLLQRAASHDGDAIAERERLDLVVRHINHGGGETGMKLGNFAAHLDAHLGVEIGKRFVEQKNLWFAYEGAAQGDALALPAGERLRPTVKAVRQAQHFRGLAHALRDFRTGMFAQLEAEGQILARGHVGIKRMVLKDHGDVTLFGSNVIHHLTVNGDGAAGNRLKAGNKPQRGRLAATGWTDQHEQFLVRDGQIKIADGINGFLPGPLEGFGQIFNDDASHCQMFQRPAGKVERGVGRFEISDFGLAIEALWTTIKIL